MKTAKPNCAATNTFLPPVFSKPLVLGIAVALVSTMCGSVWAGTLASNLDKPADGIENITNTRWLASKFKTDDHLYLLTQATLRLQRNTGGSVVAAIYADNGGKPGKLVGTLGTPGPIGASLSDVIFKSSGGSTTLQTSVDSGESFKNMKLPAGLKVGDFSSAQFSSAGVEAEGLILEASKSYWLVTQAPSGEYASGYTDSELGEGVGFTPEWAESSNAGATWETHQLSPLFLGISADIYAPVATLEFRIDQNAIASAISSALPMAMAQREVVFSLAQNASRDVNERLFRMRSAFAGDSDKMRFEFFAKGQFGSRDSEVTLPTVGLQSEIYTETAGAEFHVTRNFTLGAAVSMLQSDHALGVGVGEVDASGIAITGYASYVHKNFYVDALYSWGNFDHVMRRNTLFGDIANAEPESRSHTIELNLGYNIEVGKFVTGPLASMGYVTGDLDSYTEANGGTAATHVDGQNFDSLISRLGWQISRTIDCGKVKVTPQLRVSWLHEYLNDEEQVDLGLNQSPFSVGTGGVFVPVGSFAASDTTRAPGRDSMNVGFGVAFRCGERVNIFADYDIQLFQADTLTQFVSLTGSVSF